MAHIQTLSLLIEVLWEWMRFHIRQFLWDNKNCKPFPDNINAIAEQYINLFYWFNVDQTTQPLQVVIPDTCYINSYPRLVLYKCYEWIKAVLPESNAPKSIQRSTKTEDRQPVKLSSIYNVHKIMLGITVQFISQQILQGNIKNFINRSVY